MPLSNQQMSNPNDTLGDMQSGMSQQSPQQQSQGSSQMPTPNQPAGGVSITWVIMIAVICLIIGGVGGYYLSSMVNTSSTSTTNPVSTSAKTTTKPTANPTSTAKTTPTPTSTASTPTPTSSSYLP